MDRSKLVDAPERRALPMEEFEFRANAGSTVHFSGYASVFNKGYDLYGGPSKGGFEERVDPGAFNVTLKSNPSVHMLVNHDGLPLAATRSGTLHLNTDSHGLLVNTDLDTRDPDVQRVLTKVERGDLSEMSFGFKTKADVWRNAKGELDDMGHYRTLIEVSLHGGDVSIVNYGANPNTSLEINMLRALEYVAGLGEDEALEELRGLDLTPDQRALAKVRLAKLAQRIDPPKKKTLSLAEAKRLSAI
ncbi:HK97 family phage prohead protease [Sinomonas sp. JGH33]|uniref:HK97 family phage prohead protease n=1 Tax=Sinomonas terricola TaxID=3110330 RepID=A0ABU5T0W9_9MICC|nr:HK97 family phage prohead protease [Sinomonas sp. JGH33]MEA5453294.1 HK97 family phage prohead protease [Sinomonas sp. JGH33]